LVEMTKCLGRNDEVPWSKRRSGGGRSFNFGRNERMVGVDPSTSD